MLDLSSWKTKELLITFYEFFNRFLQKKNINFVILHQNKKCG